MSIVLASATRRFLSASVFLAAAGLSAGACGGQAVEDAASSAGGGPAGGAPMDGMGGAISGGAPNTSGSGGGTSAGGVPGAGGASGAGNGCDLETVECPEGSAGCACPGVFDGCPFANIECTADAQGEPVNCTCGEASPFPDDCEYFLQYRCGPPEGLHSWLTTCVCDPVLPTDEEPCRYYQQMYDEAGFERTCTMKVTDIEPDEKHRYYCVCARG